MNDSKLKKEVEKVGREFVSDDTRQYPVHLGKTKASSLSGFIAGVVLASIIWYAAVFIFKFICS